MIISSNADIYISVNSLLHVMEFHFSSQLAGGREFEIEQFGKYQWKMSNQALNVMKILGEI